MNDAELLNYIVLFQTNKLSTIRLPDCFFHNCKLFLWLSLFWELIRVALVAHWRGFGRLGFSAPDGKSASFFCGRFQCALNTSSCYFCCDCFLILCFPSPSLRMACKISEPLWEFCLFFSLLPFCYYLTKSHKVWTLLKQDDIRSHSKTLSNSHQTQLIAKFQGWRMISFALKI